MVSKRIFADTDVCIDLLSGRQPHNSFAEKLFNLASKGQVEICISALSMANIHYVLESQYKISEPIVLLSRFRTLVKILPVTAQVIDRALASGFADFKDAIQYNAAIEEGISILLTRNIKGYKLAQIQVVTPEAYLV